MIEKAGYMGLAIMFLLATVVGCTQPPMPVQKTAPVITPPGNQPPGIEFIASATQGLVPMTVSFTSISAGEIDLWQWDFGDGLYSDVPSPSHVYTRSGEYTISLTVKGPGGSTTKTKPAYIKATLDIIKWEEAANYIGQHKTVEGTIVGAHYAVTTKGKPTFLNFTMPYKGYFSCVIWDSDRAKFIKQFQANPEIYFLNKHVLVRGLIEEYPKGSRIPEVVLTEPSQIEIVRK